MNLRIAAGTAVAAAVLLFATTISAQEAATARPSAGQQPTKRDYVVREIGGFNVVLAIGETQRGRSSTENLPEGAARALKEMGEFLPYKSYRVLDAQWTSCCGASSSTALSGRLQGTFEMMANGKPVQAQVSYNFSIIASISLTNIPMRFVLSDPGSPARRSAGNERDLERERQDVQAEVETVAARVRETRQRVEAGVVPESEIRPLQNQHASLQRRLADLTADLESATHGGGRTIIDSSFTMNSGETVVVGTSKLGGDTALIAIVTAVKKSK
jgi:hypothetical protein